MSYAAGDYIKFTATVTAETGYTGPYTYAWIMSDGFTASGSSSVHAFSTTGTKTITCSVYNAATGETATGTDYVEVVAV